jgi:chitodextrinase
MSKAVCRKSLKKNASSKIIYSYALLLFSISSMVLSGCSGFVTANNTQSLPTLAVTNVQASAATTTGFQVNWATNAAANSAVDYGTSASYGATTPVDASMVINHQVALTSLTKGTLYHFRVRSTDAKSANAASGDMTFATTGDSTPPTISITSPLANATISGATILTVDASDNVAVASVQFKVDSANNGAAVTVAPFSFSLNTTTLANGNHILSAVATDTSGNSTTSAGVTVKVSNSATNPTITSVNPTSGLVGTSVTITGTNFGAAQGSSTLTFNGKTATPTSWSATSIVAPVPAGATTGSVVVTVGGVSSNGMNFTVTVPPPNITNLNPTSGLVGTSVTITGANFGAAQGTSTVKFNGTLGSPTSWNASSIVVPVPVGATTGNVVVSIGGISSNGVNFTVTVPTPSITNLNPASGLIGTSVTITGTNFGATQGTNTVKFNGTAGSPTSWSASSIVVKVPAGATTGNVFVTVSGVASNGASFTVQADTTAPTVPGGLSATAVNSSQINLSWTASTDNVGVTGYNVFRGGNKIGTSASASYIDGGLAASTSYTYNVSAFDAAGNTSAQSASASATTQGASSGGGIPLSLGWFSIPNTAWAGLCPNATGARPDVQGNTGCSAVAEAWSGGAADTANNRLIFTGGGHHDYYGNEVYSLNLNTLTISTLDKASDVSGINTNAQDYDTCPDGTACPRHTYGGIVYDPTSGKLMFQGGGLTGPGDLGHSTWALTISCLNPNATGVGCWSRLTPTVTGGSLSNNFGNLAAYDLNTDSVWVWETTQSQTGNLWQYNRSSNTYSNRATYGSTSGAYLDGYQSGAIDSTRSLFFGVGNGKLLKVSIASGSNYAVTDMAGSASGCSTAVGGAYPGVAFDTASKNLVIWQGGNSAYVYNPSTNACSTATYTGGPTTVGQNGTFGRFQYFPALGVFAVCNQNTENCFTLRLEAAGGSSGPVISGVGATGVTASAATITWTTDVASTSQVDYGTSASYGATTTLNSTLVTSHSVALSGLLSGTTYHYRVHSKNSGGTETISGDFNFSTSNGAPDTTPPSIPAGLTAAAVSSSQISILWTASTDNVGVTGYNIFRAGTKIGTSSSPSYQDSGLAASTSYTYNVSAFDAAGNTSAQSASASATTQAGPPPGGTITSFQLTSAVGGTLPFTVGLGFKKGDVPGSVSLDTPNQQVIVKNTWNDGSAKTAIASGRAVLTAGSPLTVSVLTGSGPGGTSKTCSSIQSAAPSASVQVGSIGTVNLPSLLASPFRTWVSGPEMVECHYRSNVGSDPSMQVWFHVRLYGDNRVWVRAVVENGLLDVTTTNKSYVPTVTIGGTVVYNNGGAALTHYAQTRWVAEGWIGGDPQITAKHDTVYLEATKLVPNYLNQTPSATALNNLSQTYIPMNNGNWTPTMGDTGFQNQIGLLPLWDALYVTSGADARAWKAVQNDAKALNSYAIIWNDSVTHLPVRPTDRPNWTAEGNNGGGFTTLGAGPLVWDVAHHGSGGYLAYIITGDYFYLETLEDQAATCYLVNGSAHGAGVNRDIQGDVQPRGVAWCIRTVSQFAAVAPTGDTIGSDYRTWLSNSATILNNIAQQPGMNSLGYMLTYDVSSGSYSSTASVLAPWQRHFFIQSLGMGSDIEPLSDMTTWNALRDYNYKAIVGILGTNGTSNYCFTDAAQYNVQVADTVTGPTNWYPDWGTVWSKNHGGTGNTSCANTLQGGSGGDPTVASTGYWGNLMPAIAYAKQHGATGAAASWTRLTGATNWSAVLNSGFGDTPIWGILPR